MIEILNYVYSAVVVVAVSKWGYCIFFSEKKPIEKNLSWFDRQCVSLISSIQESA